ncbi:MAG: hypothetical protein SFY80_14165 [Verrucomicrobiota bacterium]|nr:hypothetical protein [Verrucomicrobiota bacterium]
MSGNPEHSSHLSTEAVAFLIALPKSKQRKVLDFAVFNQEGIVSMHLVGDK